MLPATMTTMYSARTFASSCSPHNDRRRSSTAAWNVPSSAAEITGRRETDPTLAAPVVKGEWVGLSTEAGIDTRNLFVLVLQTSTGDELGDDWLLRLKLPLHLLRPVDDLLLRLLTAVWCVSPPTFNALTALGTPGLRSAALVSGLALFATSLVRVRTATSGRRGTLAFGRRSSWLFRPNHSRIRPAGPPPPRGGRK